MTTWGMVSSGFREIEIGWDRLESVGHLAPFLAPATAIAISDVDSCRSPGRRRCPCDTSTMSFCSSSVVRFGLISAWAVCLGGVFALAGCGGGGRAKDATSTSPAIRKGLASPTAVSVRSERYRPGDPDCEARQAPGTVGTIGEDVVGGAVRVHDFVACFGPPIRRTERGRRSCLYYRQRGAQDYWRFCARSGDIVSARAGLPRPG
jgi:hypothetical protein